MAHERFDHQAVDKASQEAWEAANAFRTDLTIPASEKEPYYTHFEFPYPSGDLHIGHWYAYAMPDIYARFLRMQGKNVFFPIGFDSFGLPAENAAMKYGKDPKEWTYSNMEKMTGQLRSMGLSVDWEKQLATSDPSYYKWTQWLFAKFYEQGLAERKEAAVKWCPKDATVLANEQVVDGTCERCGTPVEEKKLTQWFFKITDYADRLLTDLEPLSWPEEIKEAQRQWIGKSEGAKIDFPIRFHTKPELKDWKGEDGKGPYVTVFTTRPDTLYGATYVVIAPEHPWITQGLKTHADMLENASEVEAYVEATKRKTERERSENKEKTGVKLEGVSVVNPASGEEIPVYVADYVLASYGTGAVMAVPAHDERDFEFATKHALPIKVVIDPVTGSPQENPQDKQKIVAIVEHEGKVLTVKWKPELGGRLTLGGTAEEGEEASTTAMREIREETGYSDLELIETAEEQVHHEYFAHSKGKAFIAHTTLLHFRLKSEAREEPALEEDEKGKFEVEWLPIEKTIAEVKDPLHSYALRRFLKRQPYTGDGLLRNSDTFDGLHNREAMVAIVAKAGGERTTNYRLRDWLVSRQRYWGCPIPVVYDPEGKPHLIPEEHLPWELPTDADFTPTGKAPLASSKELHERVEKIFGEGWTPEYDTLDTFVDSSWYFMRYLDPKDEHEFTDAELVKKWMPVKRYSGGSEHTTMHLLYARFFYKALYDLALAPTPEPFMERFNRGIILGPDGAKMSKSKGNVVNPDEYVEKYGADAVRLNLAFIGPYNEPGHYPWSLEGAEAMRRFLDRVYRMKDNLTDEAVDGETARLLAKTTVKVASQIERYKFNTAVSALMVLLNALEKLPRVGKEAYQVYLRLLSPLAPHLTEYLWKETGGEGLLALTPWPVVSKELLTDEVVTVVVQINGKKKGEVTLPPDASEEVAKEAALALPALAGASIAKFIYVPGRIINIVLGTG